MLTNLNDSETKHLIQVQLVWMNLKLVMININGYDTINNYSHSYPKHHNKTKISNDQDILCIRYNKQSILELFQLDKSLIH